MHILHEAAPDEILADMAKMTDLYTSIGPVFDEESKGYYSQADIALAGLSNRHLAKRQFAEGFESGLRTVMSVLCNSKNISWITLTRMAGFFQQGLIPQNLETKQEFAFLARKLASHVKTIEFRQELRDSSIQALENWANLLEGVKPEEIRYRKPAPVKTRSNRTKSRKR